MIVTDLYRCISISTVFLENCINGLFKVEVVSVARVCEVAICVKQLATSVHIVPTMATG